LTWSARFLLTVPPVLLFPFVFALIVLVLVPPVLLSLLVFALIVLVVVPPKGEKT